MRIAVERGGGIAGVTHETRLSAAALDEPEAAELERRVRDSGLLERTGEPPPAARGADQQLYAIAVEDGEQRRVARFTEEDLPEGVRELVGWVGAHPQAEHEVKRPG